MKQQISSKKIPDYELITDQLLKNLTKKYIINITHTMKAAFRLKYVTQLWNKADVLMIPSQTNHQIKLIHIILSKLIDTFLQSRLKPIITKKLIQNLMILVWI